MIGRAWLGWADRRIAVALLCRHPDRGSTRSLTSRERPVAIRPSRGLDALHQILAVEQYSQAPGRCGSGGAACCAPPPPPWPGGGGGERRLRLRTLILIRWIAIVGQAFTIALVHFSLEFRLPLWPLFARGRAVGADQSRPVVRFAATTRLTERSAALLLGYDILQLAFLLGVDRWPAEPVLDPADRAGDAVGDHAVAAHDGRALAHGDRGRQLARPVSERSALARGHVPPAGPLCRRLVARLGSGHRSDRRATPGASRTRRAGCRMRSRPRRWRSPASRSCPRSAALPRPPPMISAVRSRPSR